MADPVAVIIALFSPTAAMAAKAATGTIPIVFAIGADPVDLGLVSSLNRPGGNITGVTQLNEEVAPKRLELLHEILPTPRTVALLVNPADPALAETSALGKQFERAATLGGSAALLRHRVVGSAHRRRAGRDGDSEHLGDAGVVKAVLHLADRLDHAMLGGSRVRGGLERCLVRA